ncbi:MAG: ATP-binding domain-containing protein, partial [Bacteroidales bacterium]|nr:ATP-binding domain-containing protein [Bacteroidales bacterium]
TVYIVDEASLISIDSPGSLFGSGNLLMDLVQYVRNGSGNKLILIGDNAQLPPVMEEVSPALDRGCMEVFGNVDYMELSTVVRQAEESGILHNATIIRKIIESYDYSDISLKLDLKGFKDIESISGGDLIESLDDAFGRFGTDDTVVLCRSNKRANRYNNGIRAQVLSKEEQLCRGDKVMVVKNCYQFLDDIEDLDFIANGDVAELMRIRNYEERYGLYFADAILSFPDYHDIEISAKIILDTLQSESASLTQEQQQALYEGVYADYDHLTTKKKRNQAVREDKYYNALQLKYAAAITCHKSQGGQWRCVFIDNPFWKDELTADDLKWLYTALTRGVEKVYLVNFPKNLLG